MRGRSLARISDAVVDSGGLPIVTGGGWHLPMSLGVWDTLRVEIGEGTQMEAWVDEEEGLSDVKHIAAHATTAKDGDYIEIGCRSTVPYTESWSNEVVWGQDIDGGANEIAPLMSPNLLVEVCDNGTDDDEDRLVDCWAPGCLCDPQSRCTTDPVFDVAGGGSLGDEPDGQVDIQDFAVFQACATGPGADPSLFDAASPNYIGDQCWCMDTSADNAVDQNDFGGFQKCIGLTDTALTECDD